MPDRLVQLAESTQTKQFHETFPTTMHLQSLPAALRKLSETHRRRRREVIEQRKGVEVVVNGQTYISFASNDYLGLADHPSLVRAAQDGLERWGVGSGSSHLLTGHFSPQKEAEDALQEFVGQPACLLFGSGYAANLAIANSLLDRGDAVFADRMNHASLNDACRLSRADFQRFPHNDLVQLNRLLGESEAKTKLIAVESVYSMDGDEAPLPALLDLAERHDAWLYVDDAHGFGILGEGRGALVEHGLSNPRLIYMATLGKAAGVAGAFIAGTADIVEWLINSARSYIYTTSQPPALACAILESLRLIAQADERRARLRESIQTIRSGLSQFKVGAGGSRMPIQPLIIGHDEQTLALAAHLRDQGLWVPAIRPPTVAAGTCRLRLSVSAMHQPEHLHRLLACLQSAESARSR